MNCPPDKTSSHLSPILCLLLFAADAGPARAQTSMQAATGAAKSTAPMDAPVLLSVFEVTSEKDTGYAASTAMSATRTNEKLGDLPNSISVMTQEFIEDLAFNNYFDAIGFAVNAENTYADQGTIGAPVGGRAGNSINIRGLLTVRQLRDGFPWYMVADVYNTERLEFSRGPGGLAYGDVDASGIINIVSKRASFQHKGSVQVRQDTFGTRRASLDVNAPLLDRRLGVRFNAINSHVNQWKQGMWRALEGYAGAGRWEPFTHRRTIVDATYETGNSTHHFGHLQFTDNRSAYVMGSGTNALDADPLRPGTQTNGVGMRRIAATGNTHAFADIGGVLYNLQSTTTTVFRQSATPEGATVATSTDPQNPLLVPLLSIPESIIPRKQGWDGPDNKQNSKHSAFTVELKHSFSDRLALLVAHNRQVDDLAQKRTQSGTSVLGGNSRTVIIDTNRVLPNPNGTGTIPNPNFEQLYISYYPYITNDGHEIANSRGQLVYDARLPWNISQRVVLGTTYRREKYYQDSFNHALAPEEIARRGFTGAAALYTNNLLYKIHYLKDGNSDAQLGWNVRPGISQLFRNGTGNRQLDQSLTSGSVNLLGSYFNGRVRTSAGVSRDHWLQSSTLPVRSDPLTNEQRFVGADGATLLPNNGLATVTAPVFPFSNAWSTNLTYGGVWHVFPWVSLTAAYFESSQFSDNYGADLTGRPLAPLTGEGIDCSVRFHLLGDKVEASATYFDTTQENLSSAVTTAVRDELNPLLSSPFVNTTDYRDRGSTGWEFQLLANVTHHWTVLASFARNDTIYTRFYPLLGALLTEARATARMRGLDPDNATTFTREFLQDAEGSVTSARRSTASVTTRYAFTQDWLKGFTAGVGARYSAGRDWVNLMVGGVEVLPATTTKDEVLMNPFFSYRRKLGRTTWTLQININNVFDVDSNQGNSYRWPRYTEPRQFVGTTTVAF